jgi:ribosomal protection tetracycline resistance protein
VSTLNLGILAHVDAGKTSLTERLLYDSGVIGEIGSVDDGSTQTDTLALERQRGITIKSAVVSFAIGGTAVNLIDTPGHPDFIAEVERVLAVLDGAVLVLSAAEGVQAQTCVLMRTLLRLRIPTLLFVNKIDRGGADPDRVLRAITARLTPAVIAMGTVREPGTRAAGVTEFGPADPGFRARLAEVLADRDDGLLAAYVGDADIGYPRLRRALADQVASGLVHPVFFGSAITGTGAAQLAAGIRDLLPPGAGDRTGPVSGTVFKVERGPAGEKVAYARMFSGTVQARDKVSFGAGRAGKVTAVRPFGPCPEVQPDAVSAGQIARLWGLGEVRIGDALGRRDAGRSGRQFAPPTLETVVTPARPADRARLHAALAQLAEQDPLINLRRDDVRQEMLVSLYGEVQKQVIGQTLADEFGVAAGFSQTTTICIERPAGAGAAMEEMDDGANPFRATVGLRIEPAPAGSGVSLRLGIEAGALPRSFIQAIEAAVRETLQQGLHGWRVTDCTVTLTHSGYVPPPPHGWSKWSSSAGDFRHLTPLVLMTALRQAGTQVLEPLHSFRIEAPADASAAILPALARIGAVPRARSEPGTAAVLEGEIPAARVHDLQQQLPALTRGEGILECEFERWEPARGIAPSRPRSDLNPLNRQEYLLQLARCAVVGRP